MVCFVMTCEFYLLLFLYTLDRSHDDHGLQISCFIVLCCLSSLYCRLSRPSLCLRGPNPRVDICSRGQKGGLSCQHSYLLHICGLLQPVPDTKTTY